MDKDLKLVDNILLKNIKKLDELDVSDKTARDEIMRSNAISSSAKTIVQVKLLEMTMSRLEEENAKNYVALEG